MSKHVGIVACSAEGAALCYRTFCAEASRWLGEHCYPEVSLHNHSLGEYMAHIRAGNWPEVALLMLSSARKLASIGAHFAICPDNTIHQALPLVLKESPIPWLSIAEVAAEEAKRHGYRRLAITGTKYLMAGPVYPDALKKLGIDFLTPDAEDHERIDTIIMQELVKGDFREDSRRYFNRVCQAMKDRGCDAAVLGCTEIPLLVDTEDCPLPALDSTRLLARAAIREAIDARG